MWWLATQVSCAASLSRLRWEGRDGHRDAARQDLGDQSLEPPDMIEIGDHAFAYAAACGRDQGQAAGC
jgi:hypothetical protein